MSTTRRTAVIFGGAGFIGSNLAHHFLLTESEAKVRIYDNLTRAGREAQPSLAGRDRGERATVWRW